MDDSALVAVHRFELVRAAAGADDFGDLPDAIDERVVLDFAPVLDVHDDARGVLLLRDEDAVQEVLDVLEEFAAASEEVFAFG